MAAPNYRATPGAWLVFQLYGKIQPELAAAYWPSSVPRELSLTRDGPAINGREFAYRSTVKGGTLK